MALSLLIYQEEYDEAVIKFGAERAKQEDRVDQLKLALMSSGRGKATDLFPELIARPKGEIETLENTELMDSDEARRIEAILAKASATDTGSIGWNELRPEEGDGGWYG